MTAPAVDRRLLDLAVAVAHRAGLAAAERFFEAGFTVSAKEDGTEVTDVDLAVEELIRAELLRHAPGDEVYGEEAGTTAGVSGRRWIIAPSASPPHCSTSSATPPTARTRSAPTWTASPSSSTATTASSSSAKTRPNCPSQLTRRENPGCAIPPAGTRCCA